MESIERRRALTDFVMRIVCSGAAFASAAILLVLMLHVVIEGATALSITLFTSLPTPLGLPGGGVAHAFVGSIIIVGLACAWGIPLGIGAAFYTSEYAGPQVSAVVRFAAEVLSGVPSIVVGIFAYTVIVAQTGTFSGLAAAFALGVIMLPIVSRTTEEILRLVPTNLREASYALGVPRWRTTLSVVLPAAANGVATGVMLAVARIAGETAPLLFTTLGNSFLNTDPARPMAAATLVIFQYAIWPYDYLQRQAWAASLVLLIVVLLTNLAVRLVARTRTLG